MMGSLRHRGDLETLASTRYLDRYRRIATPQPPTLWRTSTVEQKPHKLEQQITEGIFQNQLTKYRQT
jgi:hypothetical protein